MQLRRCEFVSLFHLSDAVTACCKASPAFQKLKARPSCISFLIVSCTAGLKLVIRPVVQPERQALLHSLTPQMCVRYAASFRLRALLHSREYYLDTTGASEAKGSYGWQKRAKEKVLPGIEPGSPGCPTPQSDVDQNRK